MKILVVGSGGREHAFVWKLKQSPRVREIFCAPGNAGIAELATCVDIPADNIDRLARFAREQGIGLTVVGPELPLTMGIVDHFAREGLRIFGPTVKAAALEGSKAFTKDLLARYGIPSAEYRTFDSRVEAISHLERLSMPVVVKADGLAAGKGVIIARTMTEAVNAVDLIMAEKAFGQAGNRIVIEEFLTGEEASFIAFTDGNTILPLPTSQDHKAVLDGDRGANTGGMGAYSPAPVVTEDLHRQVMDQVMLPTVKAMAAEGRPYKGVLYAGLMIDGGVAKVLEFNCRFGDPETQPLLLRLRSDMVDLMEAVIDGRLHEISMEIDPRPAVCVVMTAEGYPGPYRRGDEISGLAEAQALPGVEVFHAGTAKQNGGIVTAGGRVLGVTALGDNLPAAIDSAYQGVNLINWSGCHFRKDIGQKALDRLG
jgi:phosphoribosylamine---glycine ligase